MNKRAFQQLIQRYQNGLCSAEEEQLVQDWLDSLEKKSGQFENWDELKQQQAGKKIFSAILSEIELSSTTKGREFHFIPFLKIAASIFLVVGCAYALSLFFVNSTSDRLPAVDRELSSVDGVSKLILSDGTIVWLKGRSKIHFPSFFSGNQREVRLDGEALFEVSKDPAHPFIIQCGSLTTKVVGTSFNIKNENDLHRVEVVVFTGKVSLSDKENNKQIMLLPHQKALYQKDSRTFIKTEIRETNDYLAGTEFDMKFEDIPVKEVIKRIEKKFNVTIKLSNAGAQQCLISADFTDQSLEVTLKLITESLGGNFKEHEKWIDLTLPDCK